MPATPGIKIAELVRRSGTSKETIHFYLREGLLKRPKKTSRNMAYYDETHVEQLKLIKRLRTESYLPLNVIKRVLKEGKLGTSARQLDLAGELFGQGARTEFEPVTRKALSERTGLSEERIEEYEGAGLLRPKQQGPRKRYGWEEVRVAELLAAAEEEMGAEGRALVLERFKILERHMGHLVQDEIAHFFGRVVAEGDPGQALGLLRGGRETIGRYLAISRARFLKEQVEAMMPAIEAAVGAAHPEPLYQRLSAEDRARLGEPEHRAQLVERFERRPEELAGVLALFQHLLWVGDADVLLSRVPQVRGRAKEHPEVLVLVAEALLAAEKWDEALAQLEKVRPAATQDPWLEVLWGSTILIRLRVSFGSLRSSTELIGYLARAFSAFDAARKLPARDPLQAARGLLLLGRVLVATPAFLRAKEQGKRDLDACLEQIKRLAEEDPPRPDLIHGPLCWLEQNARYFRERW